MITLPLSHETMGHVLDSKEYDDLYRHYFEDGQQCFSRQTAAKIELVIVFTDIEDFDRSLGAETTIEWKAYKNKLLLLIWTMSDPIDPLGFPIPFQCDNKTDQDKFNQLLLQPKIEIHYITLLENELFHIFSQAIDFTDKQDAQEAYHEASRYHMVERPVKEQVHVKDSDHLSDADLCAHGIGYLLDYSSLIEKRDEEKAKEKLISAFLSALEIFKTHPRSEIRDCRFLLWVGEIRGKSEEHMESILLGIYMTPALDHLFDVVNDNQLAENPLSTVIFSFPEFLTTLEQRPINQEAFPIIGYEKGTIWQIELDEKLTERIQCLRGKLSQS